MPDPKNKKIEKPKEVDTTLADNMKMVLEKHKRQNNQPIQEDRKVFDNKFKKPSLPAPMGSPLYAKLTAKCKAAARRKFDVYPSAYANMWASKQQKKGKC